MGKSENDLAANRMVPPWILHVEDLAAGKVSWSSHLVAALAVAQVLAVAAVGILQGENLVRSMITGRKRAR